MSDGRVEPIFLVGAGSMGGALLKGWLTHGIAASRIFVQEPSPSADLAALMSSAGVTTGMPPAMASPPAVMALAVKPQLMGEVLPQVASLVGPETVVLSIIAGRTIAGIARHLPEETAIIRAMSNTPAAIGRGISALYANSAVHPKQARLCETLLAVAGDIVWLDDEALMDVVTAVSGSGPAYVFLLAECLAEAGQAAGLSPELAAKLARATVSGAGELLHQSQRPPAELRHDVTSPNGTTAAALRILMGDDVENGRSPMHELLRAAVAAATKRSRELAS